MRLLTEWVQEFLKLLSGHQLHPLTTQCPICRQSVRLHVNKAGRRHVFGHAQALYEGARFDVHYVLQAECVGSRGAKLFDPRPGEHQRFRLPEALASDADRQ